MSQNSFLEFSYEDKVIGGASYCEIRNDSYGILAPLSDSAINSKIINFKYYVDNGKDAYDSAIGSTFLGLLGLDDASTIALIVAELNGDNPTSTKIINILEVLVSAVPVPDAFFIADIAIIVANHTNCQNCYESIEDLM